VASKDLSAVDEPQRELGLVRHAEPNDVPTELVQRQKTAAAAFCLACQSSGLEDKEIYGEMGLDAGYFTRMKKGEATLQADQIEKFCIVVGNRIYPAWVAYQVGCALVEIKTEAERRAEALAARLSESENENRLLRSLLQGKA